MGGRDFEPSNVNDWEDDFLHWRGVLGIKQNDLDLIMFYFEYHWVTQEEIFSR